MLCCAHYRRMADLLLDKSGSSGSSSSGRVTNRMKSLFTGGESTRETFLRHQVTIQSLVDAVYQVQKDIKALQEAQRIDSVVQHDERTHIADTLRELNSLTTPVGVRLDLHEGFEDVLHGQKEIASKLQQLLAMSPPVQAAQRRKHRSRRAGLIEGVFKGLDLLLLRMFQQTVVRHRAVT